MAGGTLLRLRVLPARGLDFLLAADEGGAGGEVPEADADARAREAELAREREVELAREREAHEATTATRWWRRLASRLNEAARATGCWWRLASWLPKKEKTSGGKGLHEDDLEAPLIARQGQPQPRPSPNPCPSDSSPPWGNWLSIQTFALAGSMCLLPYMGPAALLGKENFSDGFRWWVHLAFQIWWCLVIMGVPCALCGRSWAEEQYARLSAHLGMLGITVNIVMFCHWMLAATATYTMWFFLGAATAYFLLCCSVGEV